MRTNTILSFVFFLILNPLNLKASDEGKDCGRSRGELAKQAAIFANAYGNTNSKEKKSDSNKAASESELQFNAQLYLIKKTSKDASTCDVQTGAANFNFYKRACAAKDQAACKQTGLYQASFEKSLKSKSPLIELPAFEVVGSKLIIHSKSGAEEIDFADQIAAMTSTKKTGSGKTHDGGATTSGHQ